MTTTELETLARQARIQVIEMLVASGTGHTASPLGLAELFVALYHEILGDTDRLILSAGHVVPIRYVVMAQKGILHTESLQTLRQFGSALQGHPSYRDMPALESSSGPLGQGLSQAIGFALAQAMDTRQGTTFCVLSDGEHQEGQTWEAVQFAGARAVSNLVAIVDVNGIQISGATKDVLSMQTLAETYRSFGWAVIECDGNQMSIVVESLRHAQTMLGPVCVMLHTIPGKGVTEWENDYRWHGKVPTAAQAAQAITSITAA
jgi:transketolase